jgi:ribosomal protein L30
MARNPAVGRQGPKAYQAVIPAESTARALRVKQIRSSIGHPDTLRRTLAALGIRHHQQEVRVSNTASIRGMLFKVRHLVAVAPAEPAATKKSAAKPAKKAPKRTAPVAAAPVVAAPVTVKSNPNGDYTVVAGDSLSKIAQNLNIQGGWKTLYEKNKDFISDPDLILVGQKIATK